MILSTTISLIFESCTNLSIENSRKKRHSVWKACKLHRVDRWKIRLDHNFDIIKSLQSALESYGYKKRLIGIYCYINVKCNHYYYSSHLLTSPKYNLTSQQCSIYLPVRIKDRSFRCLKQN